MFEYNLHFGLLMQIMFHGRVVVQDNSDGQGPFIAEWNVQGMEKPADERAFFEDNLYLLIEHVAQQVLEERNNRIAKYNWALFPDIDLPPDDLQAIKDYRAALRQIHLQPDFPEHVDWPVDPNIT